MRCCWLSKLCRQIESQNKIKKKNKCWITKRIPQISEEKQIYNRNVKFCLIGNVVLRSFLANDKLFQELFFLLIAKQQIYFKFETYIKFKVVVYTELFTGYFIVFHR